MTFIKKSLSLNGQQPFHNIITNQQIAEIAEYNNILALAHHQAQAIIDNANLEANNILSHANEQAQHILDTTTTECNNRTQEVEYTTQNMLEAANLQVQDILNNSEKKATQEVWSYAQELVEGLEEANKKFHENTHDLIKGILATIIKKLTSNLEIQDKMQIIVHQVFAKAQEIEFATLFFNPKDFEKLPSLHIPQNWKLEKDNMLDQGLCRLVGAGGEWKTSIALIERKMLEAIDYQHDSNMIIENNQNDSNLDTNTYDDNEINENNHIQQNNIPAVSENGSNDEEFVRDDYVADDDNYSLHTESDLDNDNSYLDNHNQSDKQG